MAKKWLITAFAVLMAATAVGLSACGDNDQSDTDDIGGHTHTWVQQSSTATCGEGGTVTYVCECGESYSEEASATGSHTFEGGVCSVCGYVDFSGVSQADALEKYGYYVIDEDGSNTYTTGDTVYFGSYPQELAEDNAVPESATGTLPTLQDSGDWTAYGYYAEGAVSSYMFYKDVEVDGERYRGVYLCGYRPYYGTLSASAENSFIDDEGYRLNTVYWFRYQPIEWSVLQYSDGSLMLASRYSIDAQPFAAAYEQSDGQYTVPGGGAYINNWQYSTIRTFLNDTFYAQAFNEGQQALIMPAMTDNTTSGYSAEAAYQAVQNDTQDSVFLLSYQDVYNTAYGYSSRGAARARSFTDYSVIQGLRTSSDGTTADGEPTCFYMLRSAGDTSYGICGVSKLGSVSQTVAEIGEDGTDGVAFNCDMGVLPALYIRVGKAPQGIWSDFTYTYEEDGQEAHAECSLYIPASYVGGDELPLIMYIADSSYSSASLTQYKAAECPSAWLTDAKMEKYPCFMLIICGSPSAELVVDVVESVASGYGADRSRLYLTGQSMGGITDFLINDTYPEMFAATVYVDCQPGGEAHDEQYDAIIKSAKFAGQKFIYIASRKDELASQGQDDVEAALISAGATYGKLYGLDHTDAQALNDAISAALAEGYDRYFFGFTQLTSSGNTAAEHMQSFKYGYSVDAIFEWLMQQSL